MRRDADMRPTLSLVLSLMMSWPTVLLVAVAAGASAPGVAVAADMATGRIQIEYGQPKNPDHQAIYHQLMERQSLEKLKAVFSPFRLPQDVKIRMLGCDGQANAAYKPIDGVPTI